MDKLKIAALALSITGLCGALYAVAVPFPKYQKADEEWSDASRSVSGTPVFGDPIWEEQMRRARDREREAMNRRDEYRSASQKGVLMGAGPAGLGFLAALVGMRGENKGKAIAAVVVSVIAAGVLLIPLAAGVF
jgi:hypothetical protein